jgi:hypothetical protein
MEISHLTVRCINQDDLAINRVLLFTYRCASLTYKYPSIPHSTKRKLFQFTPENISIAPQKNINLSTNPITKNIFPNNTINRADLPTPTVRPTCFRRVSRPQHNLNSHIPRPASPARSRERKTSRRNMLPPFSIC